MSQSMETITTNTDTATVSQAPDTENRSNELVRAIGGLIRAANLAQSKGAFTFEESIEVHKHIKAIQKK